MGGLCSGGPVRDAKQPAPKFEEDFVASNSGSLKDTYHIRQKIGEGPYGLCRRITHKQTHTEYAMIQHTRMELAEERSYARKASILKTLDHPSIVKFVETFQTAKNIYFITELCKDGELFDKIIDLGGFSEAEARTTMKQIFSAVDHMHENQVIHRNLNLNNIIIDDQLQVKIIGFSSAVYCNDQEYLEDVVGEAYYIAPEVFHRKHGKPADMWTCGVLLYVLLSGEPPFSGDSDEAIMKKIKICDFEFSEAFSDVSNQCKEFIRQLLTLDETQRLTAKQALQNPWIKDENQIEKT